MRRGSRYLWLLLFLFASPLAGQIVVPEGDTLDIRIVTSMDTVRIVETDTLTITETDTLVVVDTLIIVETDTVFIGDTISVRPGRLTLRENNGMIVGQWTDSHGVTHNIVMGPNTSGAKLVGSYWMCMNGFCNSVIMGLVTPIGFRFPRSVPMKGGLMRQAVFPLDDVRPISGYIATLNGQLGMPLPNDLGWYWLPALETGEITITRSE